ncbi:MAG: beta-galactosidase [Armatimonadota bacterium]
MWVLACLMIMAFTIVVQAAPQRTLVTGFNNTRAWSTSRDEARMKAEYSAWSMSTDPAGRTGSCMKLDFVPKLTGADVWGPARIESIFESVGVWVQNVTKQPMKAALNIVEDDGAVYGSAGVSLAPGDQWQYVSFPLKGFVSSSWSKDQNNHLDFPTAKVIISFGGLVAGQRVIVKLDDLCVTPVSYPAVKLLSVSAPKQAKPGQSIKVSMKLKPAAAIAAGSELQIKQQGVVLASAPVNLTKCVPGHANAVGPVTIKLPSRMWAGRAELVLQAPNAQLAGQTGDIMGQIHIVAPAVKRQSYTLRSHLGRPQVFEGSKLMPMTGLMYEFHNAPQMRALSQAGVHLYWLDARQMGWIGNGKYDYRKIDDMLVKLFEVDPEARVIMIYYVDLAPWLVDSDGDWWQDQHPTELCQDINGKVFERYQHQTVSFASDIWRKDAGAAMSKFIQHVEASPYADRVIGYQPSTGGSYEWMYHGGQDFAFLDYSQPTVRRFRQWLSARYRTDAALRTAWNNPNVSLTSAAIPTPEARKSTETGSLRDPAREQAVIDYTEFLSKLTSDTIDYFCGIVKRETKRQKLAGVFYGYVMEQFYGNYCTQHTGHFDLGGILRSSNVDYLMAPTSYDHRRAGESGGYMSALASIRLHDKLWINQGDIRTHLSPTNQGFGRVDTEQQSVGVLRREAAMDLSVDVPVTWYSFSQSWYMGSAKIMQSMAQISQIAAKAQKQPSPLDNNRLAVIVSDSAAPYTTLVTEPLISAVYYQREALHRSGVPFDVYLDSDLDNPKMPKYKAYLFLDSLHLSPERRKWIQTNLKSGGRVLAWVWAQEIATDRLAVQNSVELTGINLTISPQPGVVTMQPEAGWGEPYGSIGAFSPVLMPDEPSAEVIGKLISPVSLAGKPGAVIKRYPSWISLYSAAPHLNPTMIRGIAKLAGIPVYSKDDQPIYIGSNSIGLHGAATALREVVLPRPADVTDAYTGAVIGTGITRFQVNLPQYDTSLYWLKWLEH